MITLNEWILAKGNIFAELVAVNSELSFLNDNVDILNNLLLVEYGDKPLFTKVIPYDVNMVASFLNNLHSDNWLRLVELNALGSELSGDVRTVTETIENAENRINESDSLNKVSSFNSDELVTDDGNSSQSKDTTTGNKVRTLTDGTKNIQSLYNTLSLNHKNHIMKVVLSDVKNFLTLSIY